MSLKFGYWAPILSGGYVLSDIPQRTEWSVTANVRLAQIAERVGFDYTLLPARFTSLECGDGQNDALATSAYLAAATERLKIIGAFHTAYWHPAMIAKSASTNSPTNASDTVSHPTNCLWSNSRRAQTLP